MNVTAGSGEWLVEEVGVVGGVAFNNPRNENL
jgi:hypothetical protein